MRSPKNVPKGLVAAVLALAATAAQAVVGGAEDSGPLARATVMVLSSKGGVCTGVVLAPDAVLTAAHCVTGAPEHRVHFREPTGEPILVELAAKAVHPGFEPKAVAERRRSIDLALLRLETPLPARFGTAALSAAAAGLGAPISLGGYGVATEGDARSTGTFRIAALSVVEPFGPSRILVWARDEAGAGACTGDSGGPITQGAGVFALATWATGQKGRGCGRYSQGVLLGPQRAWIDGTLAAWGRSARWE